MLRTLVDQSLDTIDNIAHVEYKALFSGGFGRGAQLTSMAATSSDLYVLDAAGPTIYHAWNTGRGYEIDKDFRCLKASEGVADMGAPVAIAAQPEPGALGVGRRCGARLGWNAPVLRARTDAGHQSADGAGHWLRPNRGHRRLE